VSEPILYSKHFWQITHHCHKQELLLKFRRARKRRQHWFFEAKKRYGLQVLNFMVSLNHIHLMAVEGDKRGDADATSLGGTAADAGRFRYVV